MTRAGKTLENRNQVKFYVREEYLDTFKKFCEFIERDENIAELRYNKKLGLMSIAIMQLILRYVNEKEKEVKNEKK